MRRATLMTTKHKPLHVGNIQVRLPDDLEASLDGIAKRLHGSRSDAVRIILAEGVQAIRHREALDAYVAGKCSLERAAQDAGTSLHDMAARAASLGIPYARYSAEEAAADLEALD